MSAAAVEPLTDGELDEVRNDLRNGGNCVLAWTVRGLLARLDAERLRADRAENTRDQIAAKADELAGDVQRLHDALAYQASIVGRVEEVAAWGVPVSPEALRVALDPAQPLQKAEEAAHAAFQAAQRDETDETKDGS